MEQSKEALSTISEALAIANDRCRELKADNERLQEANKELLQALETANRTIRELTGAMFAPQRTTTRADQARASRKPQQGKAVIVRFAPAANDL
ncbi:MAG: hypothetical protein IJ140_04210 [Prevotella sp.]|nr:hypothetical protein [Prevotella sp.]